MYFLSSIRVEHGGNLQLLPPCPQKRMTLINLRLPYLSKENGGYEFLKSRAEKRLTYSQYNGFVVVIKAANNHTSYFFAIIKKEPTTNELLVIGSASCVWRSLILDIFTMKHKF